MKTFLKALSYKDIGIAPRKVSEQPHRDGSTAVMCFGIKLEYPLVASPMPDVCNGIMAGKLAAWGCLGIIHRFQTIVEQVNEFHEAIGECNRYQYAGDLQMDEDAKKLHSKNMACAIGVTGDYQERLRALYDVGCRIFCLDTANGANIMVEKAIRWIREWEALQNDSLGHYVEGKFVENKCVGKVYIISGNVATKEGYNFLAGCHVDAVRVGIAGGCFTPKMKVKTYNGLKSIEDVEIGDNVLSHDGNFHRVDYKFEYDRDEEIVCVNDIECTKNHEFYVMHKDDVCKMNEENIQNFAKWIKAENLNENYLLVDLS